ncbi:MAG: hypothetical protein OEY59_07005 [Deltaproteobacteria bacterium]|nr:hypothetical protein [Deltaproteobacteria bacterium]
MNLIKLSQATLASGVVMWGVAGLWHQVIMAQFYQNETDATHEGTGVIFIAYLVLGLLMTYLYSSGKIQGRPVIEGIRFGAIIGLLWVFPHELAMAGAHGEPLSYVFKNAAWHLVEQAIGGFIIAWIYSRGSRKTRYG